MSESSLKFTNGQLARIAAGLAGLDGVQIRPDEFRAFRFDDENETTWLIAENSAIVAESLKVFERAKKLLAIQHGIADGMKITTENAPKVAEFMSALALLEDKEVEVPGLKMISRARLCVGKGEKKNPIPPSVLAKLHPLLEE